MGYMSDTIFTCKKCEKDFISTPFNIITKKDRCPYCFDNSGNVGENRRNLGNQLKSTEEFEETFIKSVGDRLELVGNYRGSNRYVDVKCKQCGYKFQTKGYHITKGDVSCPVCNSRITVPGINSIKDTDPDLVEWFVNEDDTIVYTRSSNAHVNLKCPICGSPFIGEINRFINRDTFCVNCKSGVSFPNKVIRSVMGMCSNQIEYSKYEWCIPKERLETDIGYRYDMYFVKSGKEYIVEMDGDQHYTSKHNIENDRNKNKCAEELGIELIRIDCRESDIDYIKNNILNSRLSEIIDLSKVDWDKVEIAGRINELKKEVLELYLSGKTPREINILLKDEIGTTNIRRFLNLASKNGKCVFRIYRYLGNWCEGKERYLYLDEPDQYGDCCKSVDREGKVLYFITKGELTRSLGLSTKVYNFDDETYYHGYKLYTVSNIEMYENNKNMFEEV